MNFVSYAQNNEDVMLWRALKHVDDGFYIDVGANDPEVDSVTKVFYDRGWSGINVEPLSSHWSVLREQRPRDINLRCAAGAVEGEFPIWESAIRGWATMDAEVVRRHELNGHSGVWSNVPVQTLKNICAEHVSGDVHFLKIDVEGAEFGVLSGMDFRAFRPWIVLVEAVIPNSIDENHFEWENVLLSENYSFVYADGLNRFYISTEHAELVDFFKYPPNVFDMYITRQFELTANRATNAEANVKEITARAEHAETTAKKLEQTVTELENTLRNVYQSVSWRVTSPMRWITSRRRQLRNR